ncbi:tRNA (adenosine(37)-N6)-threonylcarbamoyltransferase complex ATPase subunit type 1 TsaE [Thiotrichales bacterium 19S11-10]|nr:tRNA (adenosine(37)-N6)-threonylcarbamoyltransferase complex ATPase subunit type 1 TsaE [Thiotrichales bacterium 19S11-10]MCF6808325.1 tRNA (adenosine(37)-N6)-threonylcarbamoyltransferase complex ATPase subunit type 1 TsaE [Thiotrichales bacterium 19S9-11]MCF6812341.1 tRNA (adenosine(37)-N6)-threonylcarbamoyltransferase complex ATPase subunit type 1 TsaE [Thiotrichales bacterium 19S9-12]
MIRCKDEEEMLFFGKRFSKNLLPGDIVYLKGDLGAGKTTIVKGILKGFGYEGLVKSPTYALIEAYEFENFNVYHFDLYRLGHPEEIEWLGFRDYLKKNSICLVEWPEKAAGLLPAPTSEIMITYHEEGREVDVKE